MPTYEYRCPEGHHFERFQKITEPPEAECPVCGATAERLLSAGAGLLFKGEGFYITDYRSKQYRERAATESKSAEGDGGKAKDVGSGEAKGGESGKAKEGGSGPQDSKPGASAGDG
jgi:putative FmdB family regulatory protein